MTKAKTKTKRRKVKAPDGPRPALTQEAVEQLRATVPDGPVTLADGHAACSGCGIAVDLSSLDAPVEVLSAWIQRDDSGKPIPQRSIKVPSSRCADCREVDRQAERLTAEHAAYAQRIGPQVLTARMTGVLHALPLLGRPVPQDGPTLLALSRHLGPTAAGVLAGFDVIGRRGKANPRPWCHLRESGRAQLRAAYAEALRARIAAHQPPVRVECPEGLACLYCGVASLTRPAAEVSRLGGPAAAQLDLWRSTVTTRTSLGGRSSERVVGNLCSRCAASFEKVGSVGLTSRAQALVDYLVVTDPAKAAQVAQGLEDSEGVGASIPAWGAVEREPNSRPWDHLRV